VLHAHFLLRLRLGKLKEQLARADDGNGVARWNARRNLAQLLNLGWAKPELFPHLSFAEREPVQLQRIDGALALATN
jgi:hypothetical protein